MRKCEKCICQLVGVHIHTWQGDRAAPCSMGSNIRWEKFPSHSCSRLGSRIRLYLDWICAAAFWNRVIEIMDSSIERLHVERIEARRIPANLVGFSGTPFLTQFLC